MLKKSQESKQFESSTWVRAPSIVVPHAVSQKVGISEVWQWNLKSKKTFYKGDNPKTTSICILKSHIANIFSCRVQLGWMQHQRQLSWSGKIIQERIVQGTYCSRHREHTERQLPISGVHSIMPPPYTLDSITYKVAVYAPAISSLTYIYSVVQGT